MTVLEIETLKMNLKQMNESVVSLVRDLYSQRKITNYSVGFFYHGLELFVRDQAEGQVLVNHLRQGSYVVSDVLGVDPLFVRVSLPDSMEPKPFWELG